MKQQDIFAARDRLAAAGAKPTLRALRVQLRGGSYRDPLEGQLDARRGQG